MEAPSPARLYAAVAGALLLVLGVAGFFYDASFGTLDRYEEALGAVEVNGWLNLFYVAVGSIGVLVAGVSSRTYSLIVGALFILLAIAGWGSGWLNLVFGLLGLAAVVGTPKTKAAPKRPNPRQLKPRAKPAGKRA
ncbi:MAG TPA: DUF4383 domain-containing protein [Solirubrobacterales bacterium]|nr:DUF4383 domain-containing protein [Solirubrobacterales bacterium]